MKYEQTTLETVLSILPDYVYWKDKQGVLQGCNLKLAQLYGQDSVDAVIGKTSLELMTLVDGGDAAKAYAEKTDTFDKSVMSADTPKRLEEQFFIDGQSATFISTKVPLHDDAGQVVGLVGISTDITQRKALEQSLKEKKKKVEQESRVKNLLLDVNSRALRAPLNNILGIVDILKKRVDEKYILDRLNIIQQEANKLLPIIAHTEFFLSLLDEERGLPVEPFSVRQTVGKVFHQFETDAKQKGLGLSVELDDDLPASLLGAAPYLHRVLSTLVQNAIEYTDDGFVVLGAKQSALQDQKATIELFVKDTGRGMDEALTQRLSTIYDDMLSGKTKELRGVDFTLAKKIVEHMGGTFVVDSELGRGTTIRLTLPFNVAADDKFSESRLGNKDPGLSKKKLKVLLVEDDVITAKVMENMMHEIGQIELEIARSVQDATNKMRDAQFNLVLEDINLPDGTGYDVLNYMKEHDVNTPMVAVTTNSTEQDRKQMLEAGMADCATKPMSMSFLKKLIGTYADSE